MTDLTEGKLEETLEFAKSIGDNSLQGCLDRLRKVEESYKESGKEIQTNLVCDFAPKSFYFARYYKETGVFCGNGGIICHGKHDNGGDGSAPTFSVCIEPCNGWQIHT